jgi:glycosyltransferase involved in cell wall biosynthesis
MHEKEKTQADSAPPYVLVTPACNEEGYIEKTIQSVIAQTAPPLRWVIVDDGSTDDTAGIVRRYAAQHPFIHLVSRQPNKDRNFSSKVKALEAGVQALGNGAYAYIGFLDADISFEPDFFSSVLQKMQGNPRQGIGGGLVYEKNKAGEWLPFTTNIDWSVSGAMQMFRRQCYEDIGGYCALALGGVDMIAEVTARMHGWSVKTFPGIRLYHYRTMGTAKGHVLAWQFRRGRMEYTNGYHPLFQIMRFFSWLPQRPFLLASIVRTAGYFSSLVRQDQLTVPAEVARFLRKEQMQRLKNVLVRQ